MAKIPTLNIPIAFVEETTEQRHIRILEQQIVTVARDYMDGNLTKKDLGLVVTRLERALCTEKSEA